MSNLVCIIVAAFVSFFAAADSLQCYQCIDCPTVTSDQLITCSTELMAFTVMPSNTTSPTNTTDASTTTSTTTISSPIRINLTETTNSTTTTASHNMRTSTTTQLSNLSHPLIGERLRVKRNVLQGHKELYTPIRRDQDQSTENFYCLKATFRNESNIDVIIRGCERYYGDSNISICEELNDTLIVQCNTCTTDRCNDGHRMKYSVSLLMSLFTLVTVRVL